MKHLHRLLTLTAALMLAVNAFAQLEDMAVETGQYTPDWDNLSEWECPDWFRDAKFGIWAHWDPQCQAEDGDWYARSMYSTNSHQWNRFKEVVGSYPSKDIGYKDLCRLWLADQWNPRELIKLYKSAGARYFMAMGQHHDNFDCWDSPYQEWNSMNIGPKKDIVGGWAEACKEEGLRFGVSMHGAHTWTFFEVARDYDVTMTKEDGMALNEDGTYKYWWHGYDPQELYAQNHAHSTNWSDWGTIHNQWGWSNGVCPPSEEFMQKFQNRVLQCINKYNPDMLYFDDTVLPFYGANNHASDNYGLNILSHFYNHSAAQHEDGQQVVVTGKILNEMHKEAMVWDVERGVPDRCQEKPWQTCTCIGSWHYERGLSYKSAAQVIHMLVDIVSKNGNLLLSIPVRGNGTIDDRERAIVADIKAWMDINSESIYGTRPWKIFGEGPLADASNPLNSQGFNEGDNYSSSDVCFVTKDDKVYATVMRWPSPGDFTFKSFSIASPYYNGRVNNVQLLGYGDVPFTFGEDGLTVDVPSTHPNDISPVFVISFDEQLSSYESLQELVNIVQNKIDIYLPQASYNTGKYSPYAIADLKTVLDKVKLVGDGADDKTVENAIQALRAAYTDFIDNKRNVGGVLGTSGTNKTTEYLIESTGFKRSDSGSSRFGTPAYWTVENFSIPQNNSNGTKNGIDNYPGTNCLMLGVWSGEDKEPTTDISNARIYKKVTLPAGKYFFAATYNAAYQLNNEAYIFATTELSETNDIPQKSLAFYELSKCLSGDNKYYGIEFRLEEETEVYLGWQINLNNGSRTQEMRVQGVSLIVRSNTTLSALKTLLNTCNNAISKTADNINDNTGYYRQEAVDKLQHYIEVCTLPEDATQAEIENTYAILKQAYDDFKENGMNPGGIAEKEGTTDLTTDVLTEAAEFSRIDDSTTRFGTPKYWTVENFTIRQSNSDGTKNGLDRYSGQESLMLGVWNDRGNASGTLTNSRIYQHVHLTKGRYFFGASFNTIYNLYKAYMFVSSELMTTAQIPTKSIAYYDISKCYSNGQHYGLYFTLEEDQDVYIGFQANLTSGGAQQEFRADGVVLYRYEIPENENNIVGDVNNDGIVDISDIVAVINTMAGDTTFQDTANVNGDDKTDISDVVMIINIIAGIQP